MKKGFVLMSFNTASFVGLYSCRQKAQETIDRTKFKDIRLTIKEVYIDDSWLFKGNRDMGVFHTMLCKRLVFHLH